MCTDGLTLAIFLARYLLALLAGMEVERVWQVLRTITHVCSRGPLG